MILTVAGTEPCNELLSQSVNTAWQQVIRVELQSCKAPKDAAAVPTVRSWGHVLQTPQQCKKELPQVRTEDLCVQLAVESVFCLTDGSCLAQDGADVYEFQISL